MSNQAVDVAFMSRANSLAIKGLGLTGSNPIVGAILVDQAGKVVGEGFHGGGPHAEVIAISDAGDLAQDATLYVTLEPCNHQGKTGPCVEAILSAGIKKVIYGSQDPNPIAQGGAESLATAGVQVEQISDTSEVEKTNRAWLHKIRNARPFFTWKVAMTLDGRTAAQDGTSKWITSEDSRADVNLMRSQSDAILIGTGTALIDNPRLVPHDLPEPKNLRSVNPIRIVMGMREVPLDFNLHDDQAETIFVRSHNFSELIAFCNERGLNHVMVEAGSELGTAMLSADLIDELVIYQAPILLGAGKSFIGDLGISNIAEKLKLTLKSSTQIGSDIRLVLSRESGS
ncbi:MAG: bifunctional diaminohydroxyphosphoribosylaminopyrimidine deaminase/5-amino-6-(5-phosphoribosylamino)uracil reductase RibD [Candidatus Nanopelagicaceae bacterium]|nr:bifunctional diaminohydroxyphosphoribosylaminopyrimidine deaminase/5-amino-6-(5-phosphoribosylamino)uracil reductase RibD [Candidatus Nanopelagicaceae bacterium]